MRLVTKKIKEVTMRNAYAQNLKHFRCSDGALLKPFMCFWSNFTLDVFWESDNNASYVACLMTAILKVLSWGIVYVISVGIHICLMPFHFVWYFICTPFQYKRLMRKHKRIGDQEREVKVWDFGKSV